MTDGSIEAIKAVGSGSVNRHGDDSSNYNTDVKSGQYNWIQNALTSAISGNKVDGVPYVDNIWTASVRN